MNKKKLLLLVLISLILILGLGFGILYFNKTIDKEVDVEVENNYGIITEVGDHLYEVTFDEYVSNYDTVREYINSKYAGEDAPGCTSVYKDGMLLRNLDWYIKDGGLDVPELVIHTTANEGRYATIGVVNNPIVTVDNYSDLDDTKKAILPFVLTDGMNSEGLMYGQNVVPEIDEISDTFGTNPDGEKVSLYMLGRQLLDYCANVDEAIQYIKDHNIYMVEQSNGYRMESHIMIADKERAVVIEFVDNQVVVLEQENLPDNLPIMTNHYLYNGGENTGHGMGYQRDEIVKSKYDSVVDWQSGMNLLEAVKYSNSYTLPLDDNFWYSEYYVKFDVDGKTYDFNKDTKNDDATFLAYINSLQEKYETLDDDCWWSNHSSVYDTKDKSLHLVVRENYDNVYTFSIK